MSGVVRGGVVCAPGCWCWLLVTGLARGFDIACVFGLLWTGTERGGSGGRLEPVSTSRGLSREDPTF